MTDQAREIAGKLSEAHIQRLEAALRAIQLEAERENGRWVHLKRVIALQARNALSDREG